MGEATLHQARSAPSVTVIMPVRNESAYIDASLGAVLGQTVSAERVQVIVVDGDSDDDTVQRARALAAASGRTIEVVPNPDRTAPVALNLGLNRATGDVIVRVDGHCEIPLDYVERCLDLLGTTGADCVGGVCIPTPHTAMGRAIAAAMSSPVGMGGVSFRSGSARPGPVDTLAFGAYRREVFDRIGRFDPELVRNQDDEFNFRLTQAGGTIWLDPTLRTSYRAREDLRGLGRQFYGYGLYKIRVMQKRGAVASPRHLAPLALVVGLGGSVAAAAALRRPMLAAVPLGAYVAGVAVAAATSGVAPAEMPLVAAAVPTMHVSYGWGSLRGLIRWRRGFR